MSLTACSDAPIYLLSISGPLMLKKLRPSSFAVALAKNVFPQPGGPNKSTPLGSLTGIFLKRNSYFIGTSNVSLTMSFAISRPPTWSNFGKDLHILNSAWIRKISHYFVLLKHWFERIRTFSKMSYSFIIFLSSTIIRESKKNSLSVKFSVAAPRSSMLRFISQIRSKYSNTSFLFE